MVESMAVSLRERRYLCSLLSYDVASGSMTGGSWAFPLQGTRIGKDDRLPSARDSNFSHC